MRRRRRGEEEQRRGAEEGRTWVARLTRMFPCAPSTQRSLVSHWRTVPSSEPLHTTPGLQGALVVFTYVSMYVFVYLWICVVVYLCIYDRPTCPQPQRGA